MAAEALHRCLQRNGISRLPDVEGDTPAKSTFERDSIGDFPIDIAGLHTAEGKLYLVAAIDRTSKLGFAQLVEAAARVTAPVFLVALIKAANRFRCNDAIAAATCGRRSKTLKGLTPYDLICRQWTREPDRFRRRPIHHMLGLNTSCSGSERRVLVSLRHVVAPVGVHGSVEGRAHFRSRHRDALEQPVRKELDQSPRMGSRDEIARPNLNQTEIGVEFTPFTRESPENRLGLRAVGCGEAATKAGRIEVPLRLRTSHADDGHVFQPPAVSAGRAASFSAGRPIPSFVVVCRRDQVEIGRRHDLTADAVRFEHGQLLDHQTQLSRRHRVARLVVRDRREGLRRLHRSNPHAAIRRTGVDAITPLASTRAIGRATGRLPDRWEARGSRKVRPSSLITFCMSQLFDLTQYRSCKKSTEIAPHLFSSLFLNLERIVDILAQAFYYSNRISAAQQLMIVNINTRMEFGQKYWQRQTERVSDEPSGGK